LAGAAVDVLSSEPPPADNPLLHAKNCIVTPHLAWATKEARRRLIESAAANLREFLAGHPIDVVSG
jgi:glycerate dehydrogenase